MYKNLFSFFVLLVCLTNLKSIHTTDFPGEVTWSCGVSTISYEVTYSSPLSVPDQCHVKLLQLVPSVAEFTTNSTTPCYNGTFYDLASRQEYNLIFFKPVEGSEDIILIEIPVRTGFYSVTVEEIGVESFKFNGNGDIPISNIFNCEFYDRATREQIRCNTQDCNCRGDYVTHLEPNTEYGLILTYEHKYLASLVVKTAAIPTVSLEKIFEGLSYSFEYGQDELAPTSCFYCYYNADLEDIDMAECMKRFKDQPKTFATCQAVRLTNLVNEASYTMYLLDERKSMMLVSERDKVPKSYIIQLTTQLTSIEYQLDSEIVYDSTQPCEIYYDQRRALCLIDQIKTIECNCETGKIVSLPKDQYLAIRIIQNGEIIGYNIQFYTASTGTVSVNSIGLQHYEITFRFFDDSYPPDTCLACLLGQDYETEDVTCEKSIQTIRGPEVCLSIKFEGLKENSDYKMLVFDGDNMLYSTLYPKTAGAPINATFSIDRNAIQYKLEYESNYPLGCKFYYREDPEYVAKCRYEGSCDCTSGFVLIPEAKLNLQTLVIVDGNYEVLASSQEESSQSLSIGAIVGIAVAVLVVLVVVITVPVVLLKKK